jgi:hypothetical protein
MAHPRDQNLVSWDLSLDFFFIQYLCISDTSKHSDTNFSTKHLHEAPQPHLLVSSSTYLSFSCIISQLHPSIQNNATMQLLSIMSWQTHTNASTYQHKLDSMLLFQQTNKTDNFFSLWLNLPQK